MHLDELTSTYIQTTFTPATQFEMQRSFELFELFGLQYYEDKYIQLLADESMEPMTKQDKFFALVLKDVVDIVEGHGLKLNDYVLLTQANEVLSGIFLIQNLEDYSILEYRLSNMESSQKVVADVLSYVTHFQFQDYLSIIEEASDVFVDSLKVFIRDRVQEDDYMPDVVHGKLIKNYQAFIGDTVTYGLELIENGHNLSNTLHQFVSYIPTDLTKLLDDLVLSNPVQAALEIITLLLMGKDTFQVPLVGYKKHSGMFLSKPEYVTKIEPVIIKLISDFNAYHSSALSADQHHKPVTGKG